MQITKLHSLYWDEQIAVWESRGTFNFWILNKTLIHDFLFLKFSEPTLFHPIHLN